VNESSLDGHYSESCELTKEMIVHRKSAIRTCSIDSDRYKATCWMDELKLDSFSRYVVIMIVGRTKDETCADG
jgi:hypothetical protein